MDLDGPGRDVQVGRQSPYPEEFRKDAVALYRAAAGQRTYAAVAADLGITAESLRTWVRKDEAQAAPAGRDVGISEAEELARLRAENARLLKAEKAWQLEREILRRAASYGAPNTARPPSPTSAAGTVSAAAWTGSARAMTMPSPSHSSRTSTASCSTDAAGRNRQDLWIVSDWR
jgi:transposase